MSRPCVPTRAKRYYGLVIPLCHTTVVVWLQNAACRKPSLNLDGWVAGFGLPYCRNTRLSFQVQPDSQARWLHMVTQYNIIFRIYQVSDVKSIYIRKSLYKVFMQGNPCINPTSKLHRVQNDLLWANNKHLRQAQIQDLQGQILTLPHFFDSDQKQIEKSSLPILARKRAESTILNYRYVYSYSRVVQFNLL